MTLPSRAMPIPAPSWYEVSPIAAAPPASSFGASLSIDSYELKRVVWRPRPSRTKPPISRGGLSWSPIPVRTRTATAVRVKPAPTMARGPSRGSSREPASPAAIAAKVSGSRRRPVSSGERPRTSWRYWAAISSRPTRASMARTMHPTEVPKAGRAKSARSTSGCSRPRCRRTKTTSRTAPRTSGTRVPSSETSPLPACLTPRTTPKSPLRPAARRPRPRGPARRRWTPAAASGRRAARRA